MPTRKPMTAEQVVLAVDRIDAETNGAREITDAGRNAKLELTASDAFRHARLLLACSRDLSSAALALMSQYEMQSTKDKIRELEAQRNG